MSKRHTVNWSNNPVNPLVSLVVLAHAIAPGVGGITICKRDRAGELFGITDFYATRSANTRIAAWVEAARADGLEIEDLRQEA